MNFDNLSALGWSESLRMQLDNLSNPDLVPARVSTEHRGGLELLTPDGPCAVRVPPSSTWSDDPIDPMPRVGDWVALDPSVPDIVKVLRRQRALVRKAAGRESRPQVIAANIDRVLIVTAMNQDFSPRRVERYLVAARAGGVEPVIVLSKIDLRPGQHHRYVRQLEILDPDATVLATSALTGEGMDEVAALAAPGITVGLVGSSGVGKSTLANVLLGEAVMETRAARSDDDRGRHTTTRRALIPIPSGGALIDTPGMRELQPWSAEGLDAVFSEIATLADRCRFRNCHHDDEPGCAIWEAIEEGELDEVRLRSYQRLQREGAALAMRARPHEARKERRRFSKMVRRTMSLKNRNR